MCINTFEKGVMRRKFFAAILLLGRRAIIGWTYGKWDLFRILITSCMADVRCGRIHFI